MHSTLPWHRPRFVLDPDAARAFLAEALLRWKHDNITDPPGQPSPYGDGWTLAPGWDLGKLFRDDLSHVGYLVCCAVAAGAIICPPGLDLDLITAADDYGDWMHDWRISFGYPFAQFALCRPYRLEFKQLGSGEPTADPKGTGCRNAWWVLTDAVEEANRILAGYTRARGRLRAPRRGLREVARQWLAARAAAGKAGGR